MKIDLVQKLEKDIKAAEWRCFRSDNFVFSLHLLSVLSINLN